MLLICVLSISCVQALGQIFSVLIGLDMIKKPVSAVIGGTKKIFHGAYEVL